ncbi:hypothetical protein NC652_037263 [Populus alba x Populus x berolinensis]|nr:hypothetical protein NC652_037263 [Populus alba x Populus x berolinensis]
MAFERILDLRGKALPQFLLLRRERKDTAGFEEAVGHVMLKTNFGGHHKTDLTQSHFKYKFLAGNVYVKWKHRILLHKCPSENVNAKFA